MTLKTTIQNRGGQSYLVTFEGRLDTNTAQESAEKLKPLLEKQVRALVFDMRDLTYISSMGLRLVLNARKKVEARSGAFTLARMQPQIRKVFDIAQVLPSTNIFTSVEEADRYFATMQQKVLDQNKNGSVL